MTCNEKWEVAWIWKKQNIEKWIYNKWINRRVAEENNVEP